MSEFLAVGNCTLDDVVTPDGRISPRQLGGNAVYAAAGMRLWGEDVSLVSVVGEDYPSTWIDQLAAAGIDVSAITRISEPHLLRSRAFYFPDGSRTDRIDEARDILPDRRRRDHRSRRAEYTDTGSPLHRRIWPSFCPDLSQWEHKAERLAAYAHFAPGPLALQPQQRRLPQAALRRQGHDQSFDWPWWDWDREGPGRRWSAPKYRFSAAQHRRIDPPRRGRFPSARKNAANTTMVTYLKPLGVFSTTGRNGVGVKMGARGLRLLLRGEQDWRQVPIYPAQVVDPTGAGDAFCGGFLVGLSRTGDPVRACLHGAVSASFIIEEFGVLHTLQVDAATANARLALARA